MEISKGKRILIFSTLVVVGLYFLFLGLVKASGFLGPLLTAIILSLIVLPLSQKMERKGLKKGLASFFNVLFLFLISLGFLAVVSFQIQSFVDDWPKIKQTMKPKVEQFKSFVFEHTPMDKSSLQNSGSGNNSSSSSSSSGSGGSSQESGAQENSSSSGFSTSSQGSGSASGASSRGSSSNKAQKALSFFNKTVGFIGTFLLTFIYIFFLLNYRRRFKEFLFRLFPEKRKGEVSEVIHKSAKVSQQYLVGKLILMGFLAIIYSIGLGISGVSNFILVSIIAALLTLIPYVGNILGIVMAMAFGYLTSGQTGVLIGIIITFAVAQFVESYVLEPYVVGDKVDLHPFMVILAVVAGGALWGVIGMILAIPVLAIITIIFLHVHPLHPFGFLFSKEDPKN